MSPEILEINETENSPAEEESTIEFTPDENEAGIRIDKLIAEKFDLSRKYTADLIESGDILSDGKKVKNSFKPTVENVISVHFPPLKPLEILPEEMDLDVVYEDDDLLVINKPKGLVVHPSPGHAEHTLVNGLLYHCTNLSGLNGVMRPGIVHRIDKDTSGLLVVAKNDKAHQSLAQQLADKTCNREYLAVVHNSFPHEEGTVNAPIGRDPKDRQKMAVTEKNSKDAVTHFKVLENLGNFALIQCSLETGRTHQIRVHMSYINHPVAGDPKYGPRKSLVDDGQLLHAYQLEFIHPTTGEKMHFEAKPPREFEEVLQTLRNRNA